MCDQINSARGKPTPGIANQKNILARLEMEFPTIKLVGEDNNGKLLYLTGTSRFLDKPVHTVLKAPAGAGKSYTLNSIVQFFPKDSFVRLSAMSDKALARWSKDTPLSHKILLVQEITGIQSDIGMSFLRQMLSEGRVEYAVAGAEGRDRTTEIISVEGPVALMMATTKERLQEEDESRLLSLPIDNSEEQRRRIALAHAGPSSVSPPNFAEWHAYQERLAVNLADIVLPFARELAERVPMPDGMNRMLDHVRTLVSTHALMHQLHRERDADNRIVANLTDYEAVRTLLEPVVTASFQTRVRHHVRELVDLVYQLRTDGAPQVSQQMLASALEKDAGTISRTVQTALREGFLANQSKSHEQDLLVLQRPWAKSVLPVLG